MWSQRLSKRWSNMQSNASVASFDPIQDCSPLPVSDPIEEYTPSIGGDLDTNAEPERLSGPIMSSVTKCKLLLW